MKKVYTLAVLTAAVVWAFNNGTANAQILLDQYYEGVYTDDIVFVGHYGTSPSCIAQNVEDFSFSFDLLPAPPNGLEYVLIIDEPDPAGTTMVHNGQAINVGDSLPIEIGVSDYGITAVSNPATLHFYVRLVGTPDQAGQTYPCWIGFQATLADCMNVYGLTPGEGPVPCEVDVVSGIGERSSANFRIRSGVGQIEIESDRPGLLMMLDLSGRKILEAPVLAGVTRMDGSSLTAGVYLVQFFFEDGMQTVKAVVN